MGRLVPGSAFPLSDIGEEFDPLRGEQLENPYPFYARARREQPIFFSPMQQTWYVTRYDDILAVLNDSDHFSSDELFDYPAEMPGQDQPSVHSQRQAGAGPHCSLPVFPLERISQTWIRRAVNKAFAARQITDLEGRISAIAEQLIDRLASAGQADFVHEFAQLLPTRVIFNVLGVPEADLTQMKKWETDWVTFTSGRLAPKLQEKVTRRLTECQQYWLKLVEERKARPRADLLSCLIAASQEEAAVEDMRQIANACTILSLAGHETTANLLGICLYRLLSMPEVWRQICTNKTLIPKAVEETLRFETSVPASMRTTTRPVEIGGVRIPPGARVALLYASANHDEAYFHDPSHFDLERHDAASHIAFGRGIHFCLGAPLARLQARLVLELMIDRLPGLRLTPRQTVTFTAAPAHRGLKQLLIEWNT